MDLTIEELDILIEAMSAWEHRDSGGDLMKSLLTTMIAKDDEQRERMLQDQEEERNQKELEKQKEKETSILIKTKLIHMKDTATAKAAADFLKQ